MTRQGIIFILSAPSGGGKTTLLGMLRKKMPDLASSISYTTRPRRRGEKEGVDYRFLDEKTFKEKLPKDFFAEWATVHNHLYGTSRDDLQAIIGSGRDALMDIDVQGTRQMKEVFPESVTIFILPPSIKELRKRLSGRGTEDKEEIDRRLKAAVDEMAAYSLYDYLVVNSDLNESLARLEAIITAERQRASRYRDDPGFKELISGRKEKG
jgi:guanylate kinase